MRDRFRAAGLPTPELDAKLLAQRVLGLDSLALVSVERSLIEVQSAAELSALADRRLTGEPVARILGHQQFYGLDFALDASTLVPRPETEMLVDIALDFLDERDDATLLDLGTGTGCIPIAILAIAPEVFGTAVDLSPAAVDMARRNAATHGVDGRLSVVEGSWFEPLGPHQKFDLITSNPPYIVTEVIAGLDRDVQLFDPMLALDGGPDGLAPYRVIAAGAAERLRDGGLLALEIGFDQGEAVARLCEQAGLAGISVEKDLAGLDRVVIAHHS